MVPTLPWPCGRDVDTARASEGARESGSCPDFCSSSSRHSHNQTSCMSAFKITKLLYPRIPPPSSVRIHGAHGSPSSSLAHTLPAFSLSCVSCRLVLGALLEVRVVGSERRSTAGVRDGGVSRGTDMIVGECVACASRSSLRSLRDDHGAAGRESKRSDAEEVLKLNCKTSKLCMFFQPLSLTDAVSVGFDRRDESIAVLERSLMR